MLPIQQDTSLFKRSNELVLSGVGDYQSTSIGKDITKSFFYGGFINDDMKGQTSARQQIINRLKPIRKKEKNQLCIIDYSKKLCLTDYK